MWIGKVDSLSLGRSVGLCLYSASLCSNPSCAESYLINIGKENESWSEVKAEH